MHLFTNNYCYKNSNIMCSKRLRIYKNCFVYFNLKNVYNFFFSRFKYPMQCIMLKYRNTKYTILKNVTQFAPVAMLLFNKLKIIKQSRFYFILFSNII